MCVFHGFRYNCRRSSEFAQLCVDPGAVYVHHCAEGAVGAGDLVAERKTGTVAAEFGDQYVDKEIVAGADLLPENRFFPEQDGAEVLLDHQFGRDAVRRQKLDAGGRPEIVIDRVAKVKIRVEIGPAKRYGDFEFRHFNNDE